MLGSVCSNINECQESTHNCDVNADCFDTPGSYACECKTGYHGTGVECRQSDNCLNHKCGRNGICQNIQTTLPGGQRALYSCSCFSGYRSESVDTGRLQNFCLFLSNTFATNVKNVSISTSVKQILVLKTRYVRILTEVMPASLGFLSCIFELVHIL